jgi:hypothetical protein
MDGMSLDAITNRTAKLAADAMNGAGPKDAILLLCAAIVIIGREAGMRDTEIRLDTLLNVTEFLTAKEPTA